MRGTRVLAVMRCAAALIACGLVCTAAVPLAAAPPLSSVVIAHPLPGFVTNPPGPNNGYLTPSDADQPGLGPSSLLVQQYSSDGDLTSYFRTWHDPQTGDGLEMIATRFVNPSLIPLFVQGVAGTQHNTAFRLDGKFDAQGWSTFGTMSGIGFAEYLVMFRAGDTVFVTTLLTRGDLSAFDAFKVAQEQAQSVAGSSGTSWWPLSHDVLWLLALVLVALVALWRLPKGSRRRRQPTHEEFADPDRTPSRRSRTKPSRRWRVAAPLPVAVPRRRPRDPGWVYLEGDLNVRCYWDGKRWTERQEWNMDDRGWVTTPLASLEHSTA